MKLKISEILFPGDGNYFTFDWFHPKAGQENDCIDENELARSRNI